MNILQTFMGGAFPASIPSIMEMKGAERMMVLSLERFWTIASNKHDKIGQKAAWKFNKKNHKMSGNKSFSKILQKTIPVSAGRFSRSIRREISKPDSVSVRSPGKTASIAYDCYYCFKYRDTYSIGTVLGANFVALHLGGHLRVSYTHIGKSTNQNLSAGILVGQSEKNTIEVSNRDFNSLSLLGSLEAKQVNNIWGRWRKYLSTLWVSASWTQRFSCSRRIILTNQEALFFFVNFFLYQFSSFSEKIYQRNSTNFTHNFFSFFSFVSSRNGI